MNRPAMEKDVKDLEKRVVLLENKAAAHELKAIQALVKKMTTRKTKKAS